MSTRLRDLTPEQAHAVAEEVRPELEAADRADAGAQQIKATEASPPAEPHEPLWERLATMPPDELRAALRKTADWERKYCAARLARINDDRAEAFVEAEAMYEALQLLEEDAERHEETADDKPPHHES